MTIWARLLRWLFGASSTPTPPVSEPEPTPTPYQFRVLVVPVEPRTAQASITPDGQAVIDGQTLLDGAHLAIPATVGPWGAVLRVWAPGFRTVERRVVLPARDATLDRVTLQPLLSVAGCNGHALTDPKAYFFTLIDRKDGDPADDFVEVLLASGIPPGPGPGEKSDPHVCYGITQQRGTRDKDGHPGRVVGRLFLPTDLPDGLGYYTRPVSILADRGNGPGTGLKWEWREERSAPPYAPRMCP